VKRIVVVAAIICAAFTLSYMGKRAFRASDGPLPQAHETRLQEAKAPVAHRIISLAPSITETLFALGLGEKVVAVTRYCEYPPEAKKRVRIGGYYDANYEAIVGLSPDLVILLPEQEKTRQFLEKAGIATLVVNNKTIPDILATVRAIGARCGIEERSEKLASDLNSRIERLQKRNKALDRPKVLVSIGGKMGSGSTDSICAAGRVSFYGQMVILAGGVNVYQGPLAFPDISREGMVELNPQVIIDIAVSPSYEPLTRKTREATMKEWRKTAAGTEAARDNRVYLLDRDYMVIPGPRLILALEEIAQAIHPQGEEHR
jgi:iron complex transport system substrate-binding protein